MRDGTPETIVSEFASQAGLPVPALPFAQRSRTITEASPHAKGRPGRLDLIVRAPAGFYDRYSASRNASSRSPGL